MKSVKLMREKKYLTRETLNYMKKQTSIRMDAKCKQNSNDIPTNSCVELSIYTHTVSILNMCIQFMHAKNRI